MTALLSSTQCFLLMFALFGLIGVVRGAKRELVSMGFTLGTLLILFLGGGSGLANFFFVRLPVILQVANGSSNAKTAAGVTTVSSTNVLITTVSVLVIGISAGYWIGNKVFPQLPPPHERLLGIAPAIISGYFLLVYTAQALVAPILTLGVALPARGDVTGYIPLLIGIVIMVLLVTLLARSVKKPVKKP